MWVLFPGGGQWRKRHKQTYTGWRTFLKNILLLFFSWNKCWKIRSGIEYWEVKPQKDGRNEKGDTYTKKARGIRNTTDSLKPSRYANCSGVDGSFHGKVGGIDPNCHTRVLSTFFPPVSLPLAVDLAEKRLKRCTTDDLRNSRILRFRYVPSTHIDLRDYLFQEEEEEEEAIGSPQAILLLLSEMKKKKKKLLRISFFFCAAMFFYREGILVWRDVCVRVGSASRRRPGSRGAPFSPPRVFAGCRLPVSSAA